MWWWDYSDYGSGYIMMMGLVGWGWGWWGDSDDGCGGDNDIDYDEGGSGGGDNVIGSVVVVMWL